MSILDRFIPKKKRDEQEAREHVTDSAVDESQKARREAEELLKSYRQAGLILGRRSD